MYSPARGWAHGRATENISIMYIPHPGILKGHCSLSGSPEGRALWRNSSVAYFHISLPNSAKALTRSFRVGHFAMDSLENMPSAGFLVARHS